MELIQVYKCLCDETRLRILHLLSRSPLCVCHFQGILREPQVKISKHLAYLREHGLVEARRDENWMIYHLPDKCPPELEANLKCLQDCVRENPAFKKDLQRMQTTLDSPEVSRRLGCCRTKKEGAGSCKRKARC